MTIIIIVVLVVALIAVGEYEIGVGSSSNGGSETIYLHIYEDNPVLQEDHFYADSIYVPLNQNITLAVQNGDDETRVFTLSQFNINVSMASGTAQRFTFQANKIGNFTFMSPISPPSPVSNGRKGPCLVGFFYVMQNSTLLASTSTGTGGAPSEAQAVAAANGPIGGCSATPLTTP